MNRTATWMAGLPLSQTPLQASAPAQAAPLELDTAAIDKTVGFNGTPNGGVYQVSVPRAEAISEGGITVPPSMGTATAINFQPTGSGKAAVTGDFVLLGSEVNPVLKTLRQHGIEVTALHSHMIEDSPHLFFMHFWANDDAVKLAQGLKAVLDLTNVKRGHHFVHDFRSCGHAIGRSRNAVALIGRTWMSWDYRAAPGHGRCALKVRRCTLRKTRASMARPWTTVMEVDVASAPRDATGGHER